MTPLPPNRDHDPDKEEKAEGRKSQEAGKKGGSGVEAEIRKGRAIDQKRTEEIEKGHTKGVKKAKTGEKKRIESTGVDDLLD